jgi:hypothetical protein
MASSFPAVSPLQFSALSPSVDLIPKGYQWSDAIDPPSHASAAQQDHRQLLVLRHVTATAIFNPF